MNKTNNKKNINENKEDIEGRKKEIEGIKEALIILLFPIYLITFFPMVFTINQFVNDNPIGFEYNKNNIKVNLSYSISNDNYFGYIKNQTHKEIKIIVKDHNAYITSFYLFPREKYKIKDLKLDDIYNYTYSIYNNKLIAQINKDNLKCKNLPLIFSISTGINIISLLIVIFYYANNASFRKKLIMALNTMPVHT